MLVGRHGGVVFANAAAERLLALGDGLTARNGTLAASRANENCDLHRLIRRATATPTTSDADGALAVWRPSGRRPWSVLVSPLPMERSNAHPHRPAAILFVVDSTQPSRLPPNLLCHLFDLTPAEAGLASELGTGTPLVQAAGRLRMSLNTARWHLKHVFEKMGVHHQTELVALVARLPKVRQPPSP
jgi:DNA-binding CsgD family transcriptional regulator